MKLRLIESLGALEYKPPENDQKLMADFYALQCLLSVQDNPKYTKELKFDLQHAYTELLDFLKDRLLDFGFHSIVREGRHCFDSILDAHGRALGSLNMHMQSILQKMTDVGMSDSNIDIIFKEYDSGGTSRDTLLDTCYGEYYNIVVGLRKMFKDYRWLTSYGGKAWVACCDAWLNLYNAKDINASDNNMSIPIAIDIMYSTEHNTGAFLNKNQEYSGGWVKKMLDFKFKANKIDDLLPYTTDYVKQLAFKFIGLERRKYEGEERDNNIIGGHALEVMEAIISRASDIGCVEPGSFYCNPLSLFTDGFSGRAITVAYNNSVGGIVHVQGHNKIDVYLNPALIQTVFEHRTKQWLIDNKFVDSLKSSTSLGIRTYTDLPKSFSGSEALLVAIFNKLNDNYSSSIVSNKDLDNLVDLAYTHSIGMSGGPDNKIYLFELFRFKTEDLDGNICKTIARLMKIGSKSRSIGGIIKYDNITETMKFEANGITK